MFDFHRQGTNDPRGRLALAGSLAVHTGIVAIVGITAAWSEPTFVAAERTKLKVVTLTAPRSVPPVPKLTAPPRQFERETVATPRFHVPTPVATPRESRVSIVSAPQPRLAEPVPVPLELPLPQPVTVPAPRFVKSSFAVASVTIERPAELQASLGSFASATSGPEDPSQARMNVPTGFGRATSAGTQRTGSSGKPSGFAVAVAEEPVANAIPINTSSFGAAERKVGSATPQVRRAQEAAQDEPVKILWKPVPQYTDEAREQRIEGDVVLLVRFLARGVVDTLRVVSGLGHGLDERAVESASAVRFEPATENRKPVDFVAQMRIRFELAY